MGRGTSKFHRYYVGIEIGIGGKEIFARSNVLCLLSGFLREYNKRKRNILYNTTTVNLLLIRHYVGAIIPFKAKRFVRLLLCPDKLGMQVSLCFVSSNLGPIFGLNRSSMPRPQIPGTG